MGVSPQGELGDREFSLSALAFARRALGRTGANPAVACLAVRGGRILARASTGEGGRPHAEESLLRNMEREHGSVLPAGIEIYTTLEPCAHTSARTDTPSCASLLSTAKPERVHCLALDPDPRTHTLGVKALADSGTRATLESDPHITARAHDLILAHRLRIEHGRPLFTLKLAASIDGGIAPDENANENTHTHTLARGDDDAGWITGRTARARGHLLRAEHDAILIGGGTLVADDPELSVRLLPMWGSQHRMPIRIVLDGRLRLSSTHRLAQTTMRVRGTTRRQETWVFSWAHTLAEQGARVRALEAQGVRFFGIETTTDAHPPHKLPLAQVAKTLCEQGISRVLVEGGAQLSSALLAAGLIDRLAWFQAPFLLGAGARAALTPGYGESLEAAPWHLTAHESLGRDRLSLYLAARHLG